MELIAMGTYRAPDFELNPGDDTLDHPHLSEERKTQILTDFPELVEEITDLKAHVAAKEARIAARVAEIAAEPEPHNPFETGPNTMTNADAFHVAKDVIPERKDAGLTIDTLESKAPRAKRK